MIDFSIFSENSGIKELILECDSLLASQNAELLNTKLNELQYIVPTISLSNECFYECYLYISLMKFQLNHLKDFYHNLFLSQQYGSHRESLKSFIYNALVEPNTSMVHNIYEKNKKHLLQNNLDESLNFPSFSSLKHWVLPTDEERTYYLFNFESDLLEKRIVTWSSTDTQTGIELHAQDSFSDYICEIHFDPYKTLNIATKVKAINKKAYIMVNDSDLFFACLQIEELPKDLLQYLVFFTKVDDFINYFENHTYFLPRNINIFTNTKKNWESILIDIHNNRINNRKPDNTNTLLSICIPSFNRGQRALENIKHTLKTHFDYEIEIVLSNNGTQNDTKYLYEEISKINDSRLTYYEFEENLGFCSNLSKVCELAKGKYILLTSDEDLVNLQHLPTVLNFLNNQVDTLAIVKSSTSTQYHWDDLRKSAGVEALTYFMLTSNYLSGHIFNNQLLKKHKALDFLKNNSKNSVIYWYPHMYFELLLAQYGDVVSTSTTLIVEGEAEKTESETHDTISNITIPLYATFKARLDQHIGFIEILKSLELAHNDVALRRKMHLTVCYKTVYLLKLSYNVYYSINGEYNLRDIFNEALTFLCDKERYLSLVSNNELHYSNDVEAIVNYCNNLLR